MAAAGLWTTPSELVRYAIEMKGIVDLDVDGLLEAATVTEMLTPGMNGHGLGPVINEHTFGHGGADDGFRAQRVAWKDKSYALVAMVNSDNATIIGEFIHALAVEYRLPGFEPAVKFVLKLSALELEKFTGRYEVENVGTVTISVKDEGVETKADVSPDTNYYVPESPTTFFHRTQGFPLTFSIKQGEVTGFNVAGVFAAKVQ